MTKIAYLVEIEVERESGKFAGRDEISAALCEALTDAPDNADLSSLGSDGTSQYNVSFTEITELDKKELKALWKDSEARVLAELPGDASLRLEVKALKRMLRLEAIKVDNLQNRLDNTRKVRDEGKTSVWYNHGHDDETRVYIPDGQYDRVRFSIPSEGRYAEYVDIGVGELDDKRVVTVHGSRALLIRPNASNTLTVEVSS